MSRFAHSNSGLGSKKTTIIITDNFSKTCNLNQCLVKTCIAEISNFDWISLNFELHELYMSL